MSFLKAIINKTFGLGTKSRYSHIIEAVTANKPCKIMEIGVFTGETALKMIEEAKKYSENVEYYGFDLFEDLSSEQFRTGLSKKPLSFNEVKIKLAGSGAEIYLFKGDTKVVLPRMQNELPKMDLIFIDGGHDLETIENDWKYSEMILAEKGVVIFDDYWNREDSGCKKLVDSLDRSKYNVKILPKTDRFLKADTVFNSFGILKSNIVEVTKISSPAALPAETQKE